MHHHLRLPQSRAHHSPAYTSLKYPLPSLTKPSSLRSCPCPSCTQLADAATGYALAVTNLAVPVVAKVVLASGVAPFDFACTAWNATAKHWLQHGLVLVGFTLDDSTGDVVAMCATLRFGDISGMVRLTTACMGL